MRAFVPTLHLCLARARVRGGFQPAGLGGPVNPFLINLKESL